VLLRPQPLLSVVVGGIEWSYMQAPLVTLYFLSFEDNQFALNAR
jgi:hypothetical protein